MTPEHFDKLQALVSSRAGARLPRDRAQIAEHRLAPVARREGYPSVDAMLTALWASGPASLAWAAIEALLNGETWFRRDRRPFEIFAAELLPALARARGAAPIRIWSAGCGSGQEAYSLAMIALEAGARCDILATDLGARAVEKARTGLYTGFEIQRGLPTAAMLRWFQPEEDAWRARPELRAAIRFERANLLDEPADDGRFDVIFCRHLLADMEPGRRARALDVLERRLVDDGCLFLGPDERPEADTVAFRPVQGRPGLWVKAPATLRHAA
jgi:chemotaxis protein methyltransferase CheR